MVVRYRRPGFAWSTMDSWLVLLVAAQVALYVWFFVLHPQSTRPAQWGAYFISAFAIWIIEWRMEPALVWVCLPLLGQISGVMPARISVSATVLVVLIFLGFTPRAQLANISLWEWFGIIAMAISVATLGMFLHRLSITSAERAELITQLQEAQQKLEAARTRDAELAVLRERERLARDLHDNLGHGLVTLAVQLEAAKRLVTTDGPRASQVLGEALDLTRSSMQQLRRSLDGLRTVGLGDRPLLSALRDHHCAFAIRSGLVLQAQLPERLPELPPVAAEAAWCVAQEGLLNMDRHAGATRGGLELCATDTMLRLRLWDNGHGLPADAEKRPGHYGLRGLRERVESLGGRFHAGPVDDGGSGTLIEAEIPIK